MKTTLHGGKTYYALPGGVYVVAIIFGSHQRQTMNQRPYLCSALQGEANGTVKSIHYGIFAAR